MSGESSWLRPWDRVYSSHAAAVGLYFMWYNFGRVHQTLKTTPAVKAGIADHVWSVDEVIGLLQAVEPKATRAAKVASSN
jgi:hypothetical protein